MTFLWTATASAINSVSSNRASRTAISARRRTTGSATATPGARRRDDKTVEITFADQKVMAVPYDMPIVGYGTDNIGTLRLWQSEPLEEFDFNLFNEQEYAFGRSRKEQGRGHHPRALSQRQHLRGQAPPPQAAVFPLQRLTAGYNSQL